MTILLNIPRIHFDFGAVRVLAKELDKTGIVKPLILTDQNLIRCGILEKVMSAFPADCQPPIFDETPENPIVEAIEKATAIYLQQGCDGAVAIGGGSVIDSAKAVAFRSCHPGPISQYEKQPEKITKATAPIIAIPTTAGTGSEVTFGAGVHQDSDKPAMNLGSPYFIPKVAICDPELTMTLPPDLTAGTGMDALCQCIEAYLAAGNNPPVDAIALDGMQRAFTYIERAVADGSDREARWNMMMAGLEGGMSIHKGLGSGHAIANTLGDQGYNHGILVSIVMPSVLHFLENQVGERLNTIARTLGLQEGSQVASAIEQLNQRIGLPTTLQKLGYSMGDINQAAEICADSIFNETALYVPTGDEYRMIITRALG